MIGNLRFRASPNYSGSFNVTIRGAIVDVTQSNDVIVATPVSSISFAIDPVADFIQERTKSYGIEDGGPIAFGAVLASRSTGMRHNDRAQGRGNNADSERLSNLIINVPGDADDLTYVLTGAYVQTVSGTIAGVRSAEVQLSSTVLGQRRYEISSTIITEAADLGQLNPQEREQADSDIRDTLATFSVEIGPEHSDLNGLLQVMATSLDVNNGKWSTRDTTFTPIVIQAVADTPGLAVVSPVPTAVEDGDNIPLDITVTRSADDDSSESLSVRITVPSDNFGPVGTIVGSTSGVTMTNEGNGAYLLSATGSTTLMQENLLNSFLSGGGIEFDPRENFAGQFTGSNGIRVDAISTEAAVGDELAPSSAGGVDGTAKMETITRYISITVTPRADQVEVIVKGNAIGDEDTFISVPIGVTLGDNDGSESFIMDIIDDLPSGSTLRGVSTLSSSDGKFVLTPADVAVLALRPPLHWSSALQGSITLRTTTIVTDTATGTTSTSTRGLDIPVYITGVADKPSSRSIIVTGTEDQDYDLGSAIGNLNGVLVDVSVHR